MTEPLLPLPLGALRPWVATDAASLLRHANDADIARNLRDIFPHPYTAESAAKFLAHVVGKTPPTNLAIAVDGEAVGGISVRLQDDTERVSAELGYWLGRAFWGRGIATEAVRAMTPWASRTFGLTRIYAAIFEWNHESVRVLEKAGYSFEARLRRGAIKGGRVVDQLQYAWIAADEVTGG